MRNIAQRSEPDPIGLAPILVVSYLGEVEPGVVSYGNFSDTGWRWAEVPDEPGVFEPVQNPDPSRRVARATRVQDGDTVTVYV
jgi:hypothetical protein